MLQADSVAPQEPQLVQAVRSVNKDWAPSSIAPAQPDDIFYVDCHTDPETQKSVVLWDDIIQAFDNAVQIRDKARVVPFLKGLDLRNLEPRRIAAVPRTVLDVVVSSPSIETKVTSSSPGSMQEKEQELKPVKDIVTSQSTPATTRFTVRHNPVYELENTAKDNYNHIDRPPSPQCATTNSSARRNPVWGLENTAMDNYSHIDNPAFAPPPRGPQALLDNQTPTIKDLPALPHSSNGRELFSRVPQSQSATTNALKERDLVQLGISASQGDKDAQVALGDMYKDGKGVQQDYQAAMDWYLQAANQGDPNGKRKVGLLYDQGKGVPQDFAKAMEWYRKAADQRNAYAQNNIGHMYDQGRGVPQDFAKAMEWYRKAADQGSAAAQYNIGIMYDEGNGVPQDFAKAMEWYRKAADQGNAFAQNTIGIMYGQGRGVLQDFAKAMEWYRKAADQGNAFAQNTIGIMYGQGRGVPQDFAKAMEWFRKAADQGDADAQYTLDIMYEEGKGVPQDETKAMGRFRKAADQGDANAQYNIDITYTNDQGVTRNDMEARKWFEKAADQGHSDAEKCLEELSISGVDRQTITRPIKKVFLRGLFTKE